MEKVRSITKNSAIKHISKLGQKIFISPKSGVMINHAGYSVEYYVETVSVTIGIGKDHVATLTMDTDAWEALKKGEQLHVSTDKELIKDIYKI